MKILGIDPGLRVTGYGVISGVGAAFDLIEAGVIRTAAKDGIAGRLKAIYRGLSGLLEDTKPEVLAIEKLFAHYKHPATAILMGHARGVICLAASEQNVPVVSFASTRVKMAVLSSGHAAKAQIQRAVQWHLRLKKAPEPADVADALAVALTFGLTQGRLGEQQPLVARPGRKRLAEALEGLEDEFQKGKAIA